MEETLHGRGTVPGMTWNLIHLSDAPASPWRNGGGTTRELAAWPAGQDWAWRISVAQVEADGPFSHFPGVQRWFAVVQGHGVRLAIDGQVQDVDGASAPLEFDGAAAVDSSLLEGPTQDLNLMVRRDQSRGVMKRLRGPHRFATGAEGFVAVYALDAPATLLGRAGQTLARLAPHSLAWKRLPAGTELAVETTGAICMEITLPDSPA